MPRYLVEAYVPRSSAREIRAAARDVSATAACLAGQGMPVRYVRTTFLPDDETWFHVFDAPSELVVDELCQRAGMRSVRIRAVVERTR